MTTPAITLATVTDATGAIHSVAVVRTHWATEGSAIYERLERTTKVAQAVENGSWDIAHPSDGPSVLMLDFPDNGEVCDAPTMQKLLAELVRLGVAESFQMLVPE